MSCFRLHKELANKNDLITHQERQIGLLERQIASRGKFNRLIVEKIIYISIQIVEQVKCPFEQVKCRNY